MLCVINLFNLFNRYHEQNGITALQNFKFGPLFMRLCYDLDLERPAVELIKDQVISLCILKMSLLLLYVQ